MSAALLAEDVKVLANAGKAYGMDSWLSVAARWEANPGFEAKPNPERRYAIAVETETSESFVRRVVKRISEGGPLGPQPRGGAHNVKMTDDAMAYIFALWQQDVQLQGWEYRLALAHVGVDVSLSTIGHTLTHRLGLTVKKPSEVRPDKHTPDNVMNMIEYLDVIQGVDISRVRFIDEMGLDNRATGRTKCRFPRGEAAYIGVPSSRGDHLTCTGILSIQADQKALIYDVAPGGHTALHHRAFMLDSAESGGLRVGDIV